MKKLNVIIIPKWLNDLMIDSAIGYESLESSDFLPSILSGHDVEKYHDANSINYKNTNGSASILHYLLSERPVCNPPMNGNNTTPIDNVNALSILASPNIGEFKVTAKSIGLTTVVISHDTMGIVIDFNGEKSLSDTCQSIVLAMRGYMTEHELYSTSIFKQWTNILSRR